MENVCFTWCACGTHCRRPHSGRGTSWGLQWTPPGPPLQTLPRPCLGVTGPPRRCPGLPVGGPRRPHGNRRSRSSWGWGTLFCAMIRVFVNILKIFLSVSYLALSLTLRGPSQAVHWAHIPSPWWLFSPACLWGISINFTNSCKSTLFKCQVLPYLLPLLNVQPKAKSSSKSRAQMTMLMQVRRPTFKAGSIFAMLFKGTTWGGIAKFLWCAVCSWLRSGWEKRKLLFLPSNVFIGVTQRKLQWSRRNPVSRWREASLSLSGI